MKRLDIPKKFIPKLKELQKEHSAYEIYAYLKKNNAVLMFTTLGIDLYLTFDGRVLVAKCEEDDLNRAKRSKGFCRNCDGSYFRGRKTKLSRITYTSA